MRYAAVFVAGFLAFPMLAWWLIKRDARPLPTESDEYRYGVGGASYTPTPPPRRS